MSNKTSKQTRPTVPDPNLEIWGGGGGQSSRPLGPQFGPKITGGRAPGPSRRSAKGLSIPCQTLLAPCKGIQESPGFWIPHRGFLIPGTGFQSFSMELGFWIPIVGGIPDSLSCTPNTHAKISQITRGDMIIKLLFAGQTVKSIYAVYDQNAGDRRWNIQCVYNKAAQICKWSSYYHTSFKYECQGFISGKYNTITY